MPITNEKREDAYFHRQEQARLDALRAVNEAAAARERLVEATGITDEGLLTKLERLGFTAETAPLLWLVPLIEGAWLEGGVTRGERTRLLDLAASRRAIVPGSMAAAWLDSWLTVRPAQALFDTALEALRAMRERQTAFTAGYDELLQAAEELAQTSRAFIGWSSVSSDERTWLQRLRAELGGPASASSN